jgi:hypothetical protein
MYAVGGTAGDIHVGEEVSALGKRLPQVMNLTVLIGFFTALPFLVMMFRMTDIESIVALALPSAQVYYQMYVKYQNPLVFMLIYRVSTGRKEITIFLMVWMNLVYIRKSSQCLRIFHLLVLGGCDPVSMDHLWQNFLGFLS